MANSRQHTADSRTAVLVLGMHRSGTSAMTRVLNLLGAELGRDLLPSKEDNAAGFWENQSVVQANEYLLEALGLTWHSPVALPPRWKQQASIRRFGNGIRQLLDEQFPAAPLVALKDPRLSRFAPAWTEVLAAEGIRPKIIVMVRHPAEVVRSLRKRDGFSSPKSQLLWLIHTIESMSAAVGLPHVYVQYDRLLVDWRAEIARIESALDLAWPRNVSSVSQQIDDFINPDLRHHRIASSAPGNARQAGNPVVAGKIAQVYRACVAMAEDSPSATTTVRDVLREVKPWIELLGGPAREIAIQARQLSQQLHAQAIAYEATTSDKDSEISSLRASVYALEQERDAARANIDDLASQITAAREAHETRDRTEFELRSHLANAMKELESSQATVSGLVAELQTARSTIDGLVAEIDAARKNMGHLEAQIDDARRAHDHYQCLEQELRAALRQKEAETNAARSRIDGLTTEVSVSRDSVAELQAQLDIARAGHEGHRKAELELREALENKEAEISAARNHIDELVAEIDTARVNIGDLKLQVDHARETHDYHHKARLELCEILRQKDGEIEAAGRNIDNLIAELDHARQVHRDLSEQIARARTVHEEREQAEADLRNQLADLGRRLSLEQEHGASLAGELDRARETIEALVAEIARARDVYAERLAEVDAARSNIQELISELQVAKDAHESRDAREADLRDLLARRETEVAAIVDALAGVEASLVDALARGDRQNAMMKQIESARWTRLGRVLGLLRGE